MCLVICHLPPAACLAHTRFNEVSKKLKSLFAGQTVGSWNVVKVGQWLDSIGFVAAADLANLKSKRIDGTLPLTWMLVYTELN